jgi:hypothetical protein
MKYEAYWISPDGKILPVPDHHIDMIIREPAAFGLTLRKIKAVYNKHDEPMHVEGFAREKIMAGLIKKGWIRVRYVSRGDSFTVQVFKLDRETREHVGKWAAMVMRKPENVPRHTGCELSEIKADGKVVSGTLKDWIQHGK